MLLPLILVATSLGLATTRTISHSPPQNTDCSFFSSNYSLNWSFDDLSNDVVFKLVTRSKFDNFYTAVGFGTGSTPTDVISVYVRAGQIGLIDGHLADGGAIESDEKTNVQSLQFDLDDGVLTAQFARPIETFDSDDVELSGCVTIFLPLEPREIISGAPLELAGNGANSQRLRVCDIAVTCATNSHTDVVKRQDEETVCASGPATEENRVEWKTDGDKVIFSVFQTVKKGRWWSAIGFGESMEDLDMIVLFAENGRLKKQGMYRTEGKMQPQSNPIKGVQLKREKGTMIDGKSEFEVSVMKTYLASKMNDRGCLTFQISVQGGNYNPKMEVQKHKTTPQAVQVCGLDKCGSSSDPGVTVQDRPAVEFQDGAEAEVVNVVATSTVAPLAAVPSVTVPAEQPEVTNSSNEVVEAIETTRTTPKLAEPEIEGSGSAPLNHQDDQNLTEASGSEPVPTPSTSTVSQSAQSAPDEKPLTGGSNDDASPTTTTGTTGGTTATTNSTPSLSLVTGSGSGCGAGHEDLKICESYFAEYLGKVNDWSDRHNMTVAAHMWKACTLLSQVQHVTTMCCTIFRNTCAAQLNI